MTKPFRSISTLTEVIPIFAALGQSERSAKWATKINDQRQESLGRNVEISRQFVDTSWDVDLRADELEKAALADSKKAQFRNYITYSGILFCLLIAGVMVQRQQTLIQSRKNLEKQVDERTREIRQALESAELATKSKREFLARANHEIRNPLQAIIGYSELLRSNSFPDEQRATYLSRNSCLKRTFDEFGK